MILRTDGTRNPLQVQDLRTAEYVGILRSFSHSEFGDVKIITEHKNANQNHKSKHSEMVSRASTTRLRQQLLHPGRRPGLAQLQGLLQDRYDLQNDEVMPQMK